MTRRKYPIHVEIEAFYEILTCPMTLVAWNQVQAGHPVVQVEPYYYEGSRFLGTWTFNGSGPGTLYMSYDDGGAHFDGLLTQARVLKDGEPIDMLTPVERSAQRLNRKLRSSDRRLISQDAHPDEFIATFPARRRVT
ncbi:MAG: hypothetical protein KKC79_17820 [Gammaproteobacteria bacterium]|nr:hypothetical protein [Gammaproteobacteria bacterium]MBU1441764.1 hypothetical protein [Gammaproteobacteria bacterium]MBU2286018.1 hypothetical protein [Gammaproteobacteria bacterium]MBU2410494.1 hypothetical protein [Gammaproteobacteria bacterium]